MHFTSCSPIAPFQAALGLLQPAVCEGALADGLTVYGMLTGCKVHHHWYMYLYGKVHRSINWDPRLAGLYLKVISSSTLRPKILP